MNLRAFCLAVSLVANLALVGAVVWRSLSPPEATGVTPASAEPATGHEDAASAASGSSATFAPDAWQTLSSGSLVDVAARLEAEGFPPRLRRVIVEALVARQFAARRREIADMIRARPWWRSTLDGADGAKLIAARQTLAREENDLVEALLGPDPGPSDYVTASRRYRYGDLPPATLAQLDRINSDYGEMMTEIKNRSQGLLLAEDREQLLYLARQGHDDVAGLLTPEQLFEYDLRSSPEGWWLRTLTAGMNPTEEEFRALFKVRSAFIAPYSDGQYELMTAEQKATLARLEPQLNEQIRAVLTPERFAEYEIKSTPEYRQTEAIVSRLALPAEAATTIVTLQKEITQRASAIRSDATLSPDARDAGLAALANEAVTRLTPTLGESGLAPYRQSAGRWLDALRPPPPPANPNG